MRGENSLTIRNMRCAPAPWHTKPTNPNENSRLDWILDLEGNNICHLPQTNENFSPEQYRATLVLIQHAPQLLAALIEQTAYLTHTGHTINSNTVQLIRDAGGPDLTQKPERSAEKISKPEPQTWDNTTQSIRPKPRPLG